jgi:hypothetical protein
MLLADRLHEEEVVLLLAKALADKFDREQVAQLWGTQWAGR